MRTKKIADQLSHFTNVALHALKMYIDFIHTKIGNEIDPNWVEIVPNKMVTRSWDEAHCELMHEYQIALENAVAVRMHYIGNYENEKVKIELIPMHPPELHMKSLAILIVPYNATFTFETSQFWNINWNHPTNLEACEQQLFAILDTLDNILDCVPQLNLVVFDREMYAMKPQTPKNIAQYIRS